MSERRLSRDRVADFWNAIRDEAGEDNQTGYLTDEWPRDFAMKRFAGELARVQGWIDRYLDSRTSCLDVGCGTGLWLSQLAPMFDRAVGIDLSQSMVDAAARLLARENIDNAEVRCGDAGQLDEGAQFDLIFLGGLLMYIDDDDLDGVLSSLVAHLAPGGLFIARESTWRGPTYYRDKPLLPGLFAKPDAQPRPYYAIYRPRDLIREALERSGLAVHKVAANVDYKLIDFKEGQLKFINRVTRGGLVRDRERAEVWARRLHSMRWIASLPWYHLLRVTRIPAWKLDNHWFVCGRSNI